MRNLRPRSLFEAGVDKEKIAHWLATRPERVRQLIDEFPTGSVVTDTDDNDCYIIGHADNDQLVISPHWLTSYDAAMSQRVYVCADHVRDGTWRVTRSTL